MKSWLPYTLRGVCMGIADVIPGVSGGTLALILGIYARFIGGLSAIGPRMLNNLRKGAFWKRLGAGLRDPDVLQDDELDTDAGHILFLAFVCLGIGAAVVVASRFIPDLLDRYPAQMHGFFFGLVLASVVVPVRMMKSRAPRHGVSFVIAMVGTYVLFGLPIDVSERAIGRVEVSLPTVATADTPLPAMGILLMTDRHGGSAKREVSFGPSRDVLIKAGETTAEFDVVARMAGTEANLDLGQITRIEGGPDGAVVRQIGATSGGVAPSLLVIFLAGFVAISAMVLPGISGSFILLMLGLYHYMTYTLRAVVYDRDPDAFGTAAVFGVALVLGITTFSRLLNWLLDRHHDVTLAALVGLMIGSLRRIWPFTETGHDGRVANVLPTAFDSTAAIALGLAVLGAVIVLALERVGRNKEALN
jgi:putative membrane protein